MPPWPGLEKPGYLCHDCLITPEKDNHAVMILPDRPQHLLRTFALMSRDRQGVGLICWSHQVIVRFGLQGPLPYGRGSEPTGKMRCGCHAGVAVFFQNAAIVRCECNETRHRFGGGNVDAAMARFWKNRATFVTTA